jgi:1-acyl-sn-glycerol-3-phosphate acyltransferase
LAHRPDPGLPYGAYTAWQLATPVARGLGRWWIDYRQRGPRLPVGPVVVAANHFSHLDPVVVGMATGRPVRFLAVDELFGRSRFFDGLTHWLGAIPMSRTRAPLGALRTALAELAAGGTVGLFPEGVRVYAWGERPPKRGAAWLARRAGVPLVPIAIHGTDRVLGRDGRGIRRSPVRVTVCGSIAPREHASAAEMMEEWRRRVDAALGVMSHESHES